MAKSGAVGTQLAFTTGRARPNAEPKRQGAARSRGAHVTIDIGNATTEEGNRYDNDYCCVCRFADDGKLIALTEYMDTALAERVLTPP